MAFLDNSGDIILDAVLTDHGRKLLAQGDGSFEVTQFALCDDEIDYSLYDKNHASGSAYYDLEILQTPVLEAFTNNASSCKNKLVSFDNLELLFLPVIKLNEKNTNTQMHSVTGSFVVAADAQTEDDDGSTTQTFGVVPDYQTGADISGILRGETLKGDNHIRLDQGLDSSEISPRQSLGNMIEMDYIIQIDSRLGSIATIQGETLVEDYIDDDHIAYYTVSQMDVINKVVSLIGDNTNSTQNAIVGPRGTKLEFKIRSSMDLQTSTFLFERLGGTAEMPNRTPGSLTKSNVYYIDSMVRVSGVKTGQSVDIPVRYVKYKSS
jgi:hypothetical protein